MVVRQTERRAVPGGAANVAKNVVALGSSVSIIGVAGDDEAGDELDHNFSSLENTRSFLVRESGRTTTRKTRIVADHSHQVLRIDHEVETPVAAETASSLLMTIAQEIKGSHVLVISDYRKGGVTPSLIEEAISQATSRGIPVVANPKPGTASHYRGATVLSLNRVETEALVGGKLASLEDAFAAAEAGRRTLEVENLLVTLGERGMVVAGSDQPYHVPAPRVEVYDTAGAGDTVIASVALGVASVGAVPITFALAAEASARVVRHVGVAVPSESDLHELRSLERSE